MTNYRININTNDFIQDENNLGAFFYTSDWRAATSDEAAAYELGLVKTKKIDQLAKNRAQLAENSTVSYDGETYSNSQNARIAILRYITKMTANSKAVSYFTYPDRGVAEFVKADFQAIATLIEERETSLRIAEIGLIEQINACETIEAVNAIDISLIS